MIWFLLVPLAAAVTKLAVDAYQEQEKAGQAEQQARHEKQLKEAQEKAQEEAAQSARLARLAHKVKQILHSFHQQIAQLLFRHHTIVDAKVQELDRCNFSFAQLEILAMKADPSSPQEVLEALSSLDLEANFAWQYQQRELQMSDLGKQIRQLEQLSNNIMAGELQ